MASPFAHVDASTLVGSWPILPALTGAGVPTIRPGTLVPSARILGFRREEVAGYDVGGLSFKLTVDGSLSTISFLAGGPYTLDEVISRINSEAGVSVAFRDNGFLRLESPTVGVGSSLLLETDSASSTSPVDVFSELGLLSGTESVTGDFVTATHVDPDRQVALPGQLSLMAGEDLSNDAVNRSIAQLAINSDITYGLVNRKKLAAASSYVWSPGAPTDNVTIPAVVYTGPNVAPTPLFLHDVVVVLDQSGNELTQKTETVDRSLTNVDLSVDADSGDQLITVGGGDFVGIDPADDVYYRSSDAGMGALQDVLLKIVKVIGPNDAVLRNVTPAGVKVDVTLVGSSGDVIVIDTDRVLVEELLDGPGGTRVEQVEQPRHSGTVTRIDGNNRLVATGENFLAPGSTKVVEGDLVVLAGHNASFPYKNDGTYRVLNVVDDEVIELVAEDYGPAFLNPTGSLGTYTIKSDGNFYENPNAKLSHTVAAGTYQILFREQKTLSEITDKVDGLSGGSLYFTQETDSRVERALLGIMGPNTTAIDDYIYGDRRNNLEALGFRLNDEHDESGRHSDIRPDTIDMFPEVAGETVTVRVATADTAGTAKFILRDAGGSAVFSMSEAESVWDDGNGTISAGFQGVSTGPNVVVTQAGAGGDSIIRVESIVGAAAGVNTLLQVYNLHSTGVAKIDLIGQVQDDGAEFNIQSFSSDFKFIASHTDASLRIDIDGTHINAQSWGTDGVVRFYDRVEIDDTSVAIDQVIQNYAGFPTALLVGREINKWGVIIDGDEVQADLLFKCEDTTPVADENIVQFVQTRFGDFLVRGLTDNFTTGGQNNYLWFDLSYTDRMGLLMDVAASFTELPNATADEDRYAQLEGSLIIGNRADFATFDEGTGAGPGEFPVADASITGEKLVWLDITSSFLMASQDGTGRFNMYWNSFRDDGNNGWTADGAQHRFVRKDEPAIRVEFKTDGDIVFNHTEEAVANGDGIGGNWAIDWEQSLALRGPSGDRTPTAEAPNRLLVSGYQEFTELSTDLMIENVRAAHPQVANDSRPYLAYDFAPSIGINFVGIPWTPDEWVLYKKWVYIIEYTGTIGQIRMRRVDTTTLSVVEGSDILLSTIDGLDTVYGAIVVGDYLYVKGHQTGSGRNRWVIGKISLKDPANPVLVGDVGSGIGSTGSTWGLVSDGVYIYLIENIGTLTGAKYLVKINANATSDAAPTRDFTADITPTRIDSQSGYYPDTGSKGLAFDGSYVYWLFASNNVGDEGVWATRMQPNARTASAPDTGFLNEWQIDTVVPNTTYFNAQCVSDGHVVWYSWNRTFNSHQLAKYALTNLIGSAAQTTENSIDVAVDDRFVYLTNNYAWWYYKHDVELAMSPSYANNNTSGVHGTRLLLDHSWIYGFSGTNFYRSPRPR